MAPSEFALLATLLGALTAIVPLSVDPTLASMPLAAAALGTDARGIQTSLSAFMLGVAAGQLVLGPLSDRFGRKPVLLVHVALYAAASAGCAAAPDLETLIASRLVQGYAACSAHVISRAIVRDRLEREDAARMLSWVMIVHGLAPLLGPIAGAHLAVGYGWRSVFLAIGAYGALVLVVLAARLKESLARPDLDSLVPRRLVRNYGTVLRSRVFLAYTACTASCFGGLFAFLSLSSPLLTSRYHVSTEGYGYFFAATMVGYVTGNWLSTRLVRRLGVDPLLRLGAVALAVCGTAVGAQAWLGFDSALAIGVPFFFWMMALPLVVPQATTGALTPFPMLAGTASSVLGFLQLSASTSAGTLAGAFYDGTQTAMTTTIFLMSLGPLAVYWLFIRGRRGVPKPG
jgi:DHA1 family bicyclomycin/chloramphenicol resistance-like MFS transporter